MIQNDNNQMCNVVCTPTRCSTYKTALIFHYYFFPLFVRKAMNIVTKCCEVQSKNLWNSVPFYITASFYKDECITLEPSKNYHISILKFFKLGIDGIRAEPCENIMYWFSYLQDYCVTPPVKMALKCYLSKTLQINLCNSNTRHVDVLTILNDSRYLL